MSAILALGAAGALYASQPVAVADASAGKSCLRIRDLGNMKPLNDTTLVATSRSSGNYIVKLRGKCPDFNMMGNFYTVQALSTWECFDRDDVLRFRYGGVCFIDSVTAARR
jgi:hypothetical protein